MTKIAKLGHHLEICFSVDSLSQAIEYYLQLGFVIYSGGTDKGWCTLTDGITYFALFPNNFIENEFGVKTLLNYRGGNILKITSALQQQGIALEKVTANMDGTGSALFTDIAGNRVFVDTGPDEERIDYEK